MDVEDLEIYQEAMTIGESVWGMVGRWRWFSRWTVGQQFVKAADSIAANISEGYARYFYGEKRKFFCYSRGSLGESLTWLEKSRNRDLASEAEYETLRQAMKQLQKRLNAYINYIERERRNDQ